MIGRICIFGLLVLSSKSDEELPVKERIKLLKFQLEQELKEKTQQEKVFLRESDAALLNAQYDYVDLSKVAITPISDKDDRKKNERFKLRQLATSPKSTTVWTRKSSWPQIVARERHDYFDVPSPTTPPQKLFNPLSDENIAKANTDNKPTGIANIKPAQRTAENEASSGKPVEIFYKQRRLLQDESMRDTPIQWTHCEDMITPFLTGMKGSLNAPLILAPSHRTVLRLINLLSTNVTRASKEDLLSLMYQISNVQIRLFQWQENSLSLLLDVLCKGKKHTFGNLRHGLLNLFGLNWHIDYSNTSNLLQQARVFRPACVNSINNEGSTKSSKVPRYTRPKKTTTKCDED